MENLKFKTKIFDLFRCLGKYPIFEKILHQLVKDRHYSHFLARLLLPRWYMYNPSEYRIVEREGIHFRLFPAELADYLVYFQLVEEPRSLLYSLVKPNSIVFDIGTNLGETLLNFAKRCPNGKVHGFEPVPFLFSRAVYNLELNSFENIKLNNVALSDRKEELEIAEGLPYNSAATFLRKSITSKKDLVLATTVDSYAEENGIIHIDFMKIDVEGFEMNVLKGAENILKRDKPMLFVEVNDSYLRRQQSSASYLINFLENLGYLISSAQTSKKVSSTNNFDNCHFDIICV